MIQTQSNFTAIFKKVKKFIIYKNNNIGIELWIENKKGKNNPKEEPYFKVSKREL
jgi:hypothetical protein